MSRLPYDPHRGSNPSSRAHGGVAGAGGSRSSAAAPSRSRPSMQHARPPAHSQPEEEEDSFDDSYDSSDSDSDSDTDSDSSDFTSSGSDSPSSASSPSPSPSPPPRRASVASSHTTHSSDSRRSTTTARSSGRSVSFGPDSYRAASHASSAAAAISSSTTLAASASPAAPVPSSRSSGSMGGASFAVFTAPLLVRPAPPLKPIIVAAPRRRRSSQISRPSSRRSTAEPNAPLAKVEDAVPTPAEPIMDTVGEEAPPVPSPQPSGDPSPPPSPPLSPSLLSLRSSLARHPRLMLWFSRFFHSFAQRVQRGFMSFGEYEALHLRMSRVLFERWDRPQARRLAKLDWRRDTHAQLPGASLGHTTKGALMLSFPHFAHSMFELTDLWTEGIGLREYEEFLSGLYERVMRVSEGDVAPAEGEVEEMDEEGDGAASPRAGGESGTARSRSLKSLAIDTPVHHADPAHQHNVQAQKRLVALDATAEAAADLTDPTPASSGPIAPPSPRATEQTNPPSAPLSPVSSAAPAPGPASGGLGDWDRNGWESFLASLHDDDDGDDESEPDQDEVALEDEAAYIAQLDLLADGNTAESAALTALLRSKGTRRLRILPDGSLDTGRLKVFRLVDHTDMRFHGVGFVDPNTPLRDEEEEEAEQQFPTPVFPGSKRASMLRMSPKAGEASMAKPYVRRGQSRIRMVSDGLGFEWGAGAGAGVDTGHPSDGGSDHAPARGGGVGMSSAEREADEDAVAFAAEMPLPPEEEDSEGTPSSPTATGTTASVASPPQHRRSPTKPRLVKPPQFRIQRGVHAAVRPSKDLIQARVEHARAVIPGTSRSVALSGNGNGNGGGGSGGGGGGGSSDATRSDESKESLIASALAARGKLRSEKAVLEAQKRLAESQQLEEQRRAEQQAVEERERDFFKLMDDRLAREDPSYVPPAYVPPPPPPRPPSPPAQKMPLTPVIIHRSNRGSGGVRPLRVDTSVTEQTMLLQRAGGDESALSSARRGSGGRSAEDDGVSAWNTTAAAAAAANANADNDSVESLIANRIRRTRRLQIRPRARPHGPVSPRDREVSPEGHVIHRIERTRQSSLELELNRAARIELEERKRRAREQKWEALVSKWNNEIDNDEDIDRKEDLDEPLHPPVDQDAAEASGRGSRKNLRSEVRRSLRLQGDHLGHMVNSTEKEQDDASNNGKNTNASRNDVAASSRSGGSGGGAFTFHGHHEGDHLNHDHQQRQQPPSTSLHRSSDMYPTTTTKAPPNLVAEIAQLEGTLRRAFGTAQDGAGAGAGAEAAPGAFRPWDAAEAAAAAAAAVAASATAGVHGTYAVAHAATAAAGEAGPPSADVSATSPRSSPRRVPVPSLALTQPQPQAPGHSSQRRFSIPSSPAGQMALLKDLQRLRFLRAQVEASNGHGVGGGGGGRIRHARGSLRGSLGGGMVLTERQRRDVEELKELEKKIHQLMAQEGADESPMSPPGPTNVRGSWSMALAPESKPRQADPPVPAPSGTHTHRRTDSTDSAYEPLLVPLPPLPPPPPPFFGIHIRSIDPPFAADGGSATDAFLAGGPELAHTAAAATAPAAGAGLFLSGNSEFWAMRQRMVRKRMQKYQKWAREVREEQEEEEEATTAEGGEGGTGRVARPKLRPAAAAAHIGASTAAVGQPSHVTSLKHAVVQRVPPLREHVVRNLGEPGLHFPPFRPDEPASSPHPHPLPSTRAPTTSLQAPEAELLALMRHQHQERKGARKSKQQQQWQSLPGHVAPGEELVHTGAEEQEKGSEAPMNDMDAVGTTDSGSFAEAEQLPAAHPSEAASSDHAARKQQRREERREQRRAEKGARRAPKLARKQQQQVQEQKEKSEEGSAVDQNPSVGMGELSHSMDKPSSSFSPNDAADLSPRSSVSSPSSSASGHASPAPPDSPPPEELPSEAQHLDAPTAAPVLLPPGFERPSTEAVALQQREEHAEAQTQAQAQKQEQEQRRDRRKQRRKEKKKEKKALKRRAREQTQAQETVVEPMHANQTASAETPPSDGHAHSVGPWNEEEPGPDGQHVSSSEEGAEGEEEEEKGQQQQQKVDDELKRAAAQAAQAAHAMARRVARARQARQDALAGAFTRLPPEVRTQILDAGLGVAVGMDEGTMKRQQHRSQHMRALVPNPLSQLYARIHSTLGGVVADDETTPRSQREVPTPAVGSESHGSVLDASALSRAAALRLQMSRADSLPTCAPLPLGAGTLHPVTLAFGRSKDGGAVVSTKSSRHAAAAAAAAPRTMPADSAAPSPRPLAPSRALHRFFRRHAGLSKVQRSEAKRESTEEESAGDAPDRHLSDTGAASLHRMSDDPSAWTPREPPPPDHRGELMWDTQESKQAVPTQQQSEGARRWDREKRASTVEHQPDARAAGDPLPRSARAARTPLPPQGHRSARRHVEGGFHGDVAEHSSALAQQQQLHPQSMSSHARDPRRPMSSSTASSSCSAGASPRFPALEPPVSAGRAPRHATVSAFRDSSHAHSSRASPVPPLSLSLQAPALRSLLASAPSFPFTSRPLVSSAAGQPHPVAAESLARARRAPQSAR